MSTSDQPNIKIRVYVAGPYTIPDPEANTIAAITVGHHLLDLGYAPLIPHLTHYMEIQRSRPYEDWMSMDYSWLVAAHVVLRIPGESSGADRECFVSRESGIPIVYSIDELAQRFPPRINPTELGY